MVRLLLTMGAVVVAALGTMRLQSADLATGQAVPRAFMARDCGGNNTSPSLAWSGAPRNTASFALILHDADAPIPGGFYHWVVYNLPNTMHRLDTGMKLASDQLGETSASQAQYYGPCPPAGPAHHYTITVYALDLGRISANVPLTGAQLERKIDGHVIARAVLQTTASH